MFDVLQIDSVVLDADKLVNHCLVGPLVEQRRDRVLLSIADEYVRGRRVARHSIDEVCLLTQLLLRLLGNVPAQRAVILVAKDRVRACGHDHSKEAIDDTICSNLILVRPLVGRVQAQTERAAYIQAEQVLVDRLEVSKDFLDLVDHVVNIILSELLNFGIGNGV